MGQRATARARPRVRAVTALTLTSCLLALTACATHVDGPDPSVAAGSTTGTPPSAVSAASSSAVPVAGSSPPVVSAEPSSPTESPAQVSAAVAALVAAQPGVVDSIAELNTVTGAAYTTGASSGLWTASDYKLIVLQTLLLQHQDAGAALSDDDQDDATAMIENSDNTAGYELFTSIGGTPGLAAGARQLGLTQTVPGRSDPTFTTTGAPDCLTLLKNLVTTGPLDAASRSFALGLMRSVESDQRWGVGVVADPGTTPANKNGWLSVDNTNGPGEDDNDLWVVNSIGVVTVKGQPILMAVLTEHDPDYATGVTLVESIAKAMIPAVSS